MNPKTIVDKKSPRLPPLRRMLAWSIHLLTASGAAWGFLALLSLQAGEYRNAMLWMILSIFVDSFDGTLARLVNVRKYAAGIDGALLDNILDYFTYVIVPAYALYSCNLLPAGWGLPGAISILLTSAYQFTQVDAKTEDHYFKGFPSYWNVVVIYMFTLQIPIWWNFGIIALLNILVFVPVKYVYPSRTVTAHRLTLVLTYMYGILGTAAVAMYPHTPRWMMLLSFTYIAYYAGLSLLPKQPAGKKSNSA